jgi:hypothetical protein
MSCREGKGSRAGPPPQVGTRFGGGGRAVPAGAGARAVRRRCSPPPPRRRPVRGAGRRPGPDADRVRHGHPFSSIAIHRSAAQLALPLALRLLRLGGLPSLRLALPAPLHRPPGLVEHRRRAGAADRPLVAEAVARPADPAARAGRRRVAEVAAVGRAVGGPEGRPGEAPPRARRAGRPPGRAGPEARPPACSRRGGRNRPGADLAWAWELAACPPAWPIDWRIVCSPASRPAISFW